MGAGIAAAAKTALINNTEKTGTRLDDKSEYKKLESSELNKTPGKESLEPAIEKAKHLSLESIIEENKTKAALLGEAPENADISESDEYPSGDGSESTNEAGESNEGLTDEEKQRIKEETGWSDEIINNIRSWEEYQIYRDAGLKEVEIGGHKALIRSDIDWNQKDEKGRTNTERAERGLSPLDKDGNQVQLHHIGQHADSPLAELTFKEHRSEGNDTILHDKKKETETHGEGNNWNNERQNYWKDRAEYNEEMSNSG